MWSNGGIPPPPFPDRRDFRGAPYQQQQQHQHAVYQHQPQEPQMQHHFTPSPYGPRHQQQQQLLSNAPSYPQPGVYQSNARTYELPTNGVHHPRDVYETRSIVDPAFQHRQVEEGHRHPPSHHTHNQEIYPPSYPAPRYAAPSMPVATTNTAVSPQAPPPPPPMFKPLAVRPEQYDDFLSNRCLTDLIQGTFVLPQFVPKDKRPPTSGSAGMITVDLDLWNDYWAAFSEQVSTHEEAVQTAIREQESASGQEMGSGPGKLNRRSVIVKIPPPFSVESFLSPMQLQQHVLHVATMFGTIESCRLQHDEIRLQFTMSNAAIHFASFVRTMDAGVMFPKQLIGGTGPQRLGGARVHVFLLEQRPPVVLPGDAPHLPQKHCTRLILGKKVDIPSIFLNALFRDLFEADHIEYQSGSFVISFATYELCKYALHTLQQSLRQVFGLTLGYHDQRDAPPLDLCGV